MRIDLRWLISAAICCLSVPAAGDSAQADEPLEFTVQYRDGTIIRLPVADGTIPWRRITIDGRILEEPIPLSRVKTLKIVVTPGTEQVAQVRRMVADLADPDFHKRTAAQERLIKEGARYRIILERAREEITDFEARWRLGEVLKLLPSEGEVLDADYDLLTSRSGEEVQGDISGWSIEAEYRGRTVKLDRASVRAIELSPPRFTLTAEPPVVIIDRILKDVDKEFPENVTRVDFERGPRGVSIQPGDNVEKTYIGSGCSLSTSVKGAFVSITPYSVGGRSGGQSAATNEPLYGGEITVRFCLPGNEQAPAGVSVVGFWTSHIAPEGTSLVAYDIRNRRLAEIKTQQTGRDFLALRCNTPIAYIKVVPDLDIDPDYAIDDLVFDPPRPLAEGGDPRHFSVLLTTGERLQAGKLTPGNPIVLEELTIGIERLEIPQEQLAVVVPPKNPALVAAVQKDAFVRLSDGSVLRARGGTGLKLVRFPDLPVTEEGLAALWGADTPLVDPDVSAWPEEGALLIDQDGAPLPLREWRLGDEWIESPAVEQKGKTYESSPVVWFSRPERRPLESGLLRTVGGEEIVLANEGAAGFALDSWTAEGVIIRRGDSTWRFAPEEVGSLLLPGRAQE